MSLARNLSVIAYNNGFTLWHYKARDVADALRDGHFADTADMLAAGDVIMLTDADGCFAMRAVCREAGRILLLPPG